MATIPIGRPPLQAPSLRGPFSTIGGRIVGSGDRPLILLHARGATRLDYVSARVGETIHLAGGGAIRGKFLIAPAEAGVPGALPYWGGPGIGLWEAVAKRLPVRAEQEVLAHPGRCLSREQLRSLIGRIMDDATKGHLIIIGRKSPLHAGHPAIRLDASVHAFWNWDVVTEQAVPHPQSGGLLLMAVRILTPAEWGGLAKTRPGGPRVPSRGRPSQQEVNAWMLADFRTARDKGRPPPKRDDDAIPRCAKHINATQKQAREAIGKVPEELRRRRGSRDR